MANKKQHTVRLAAYTSKGIACGTHEADQVHLFRNDKNTVHVKYVDANTVLVITHKNQYPLTKHSTITNLWCGVTDDGIKVHFTMKKIVGKFIY